MADQVADPAPAKPPAKRRRVPIAYVVVLAVVAVAAFIFGTHRGGHDGLQAQTGTAVDDGAQPFAMDPLVMEENLNQQGEPGRYTVYGYFTSTMRTGRVAAIPLINPERNDVYFKFTVLYGDEVLFQSNWVPPGNGIFRQELARDLAVGDHDVRVNIDVVEREAPHAPMDSTGVNMVLTVEPT
ncbi:MAG: hypothetical protein FWF90_08030 [Promicromonosporaceae bacterium]|nr:hypothetical protein [Promicromonosporaceae bacterium]